MDCQAWPIGTTVRKNSHVLLVRASRMEGVRTIRLVIIRRCRRDGLPHAVAETSQERPRLASG